MHRVEKIKGEERQSRSRGVEEKEEEGIYLRSFFLDTSYLRHCECP